MVQLRERNILRDRLYLFEYIRTSLSLSPSVKHCYVMFNDLHTLHAVSHREITTPKQSIIYIICNMLRPLSVYHVLTGMFDLFVYTTIYSYRYRAGRC